MPPLKSNHISPTDEEDAAITAAAMADPDTFHPTEENLARLSQMKPYRVSIRSRPIISPDAPPRPSSTSSDSPSQKWRQNE
ncbi:hypothetical protein [Pelistega suis]|uniref:Uncharacterized protein n=1 Tax=Pelistega suis TaxID=1631957 RepID=A0A849PA10_9BURK|nr:hypothetical protein [Pelistega suis]NOL52562.1 hypothetical protein [Pelistega suis]